MARSRPGGPPPVRSVQEALGFKNLAQELFATMFISNELLFRSLILAELVLLVGGNFSLESPESSLTWEAPQLKSLVQKFRLFFVDTDECEFGALSLKPTRFLVSHALCKEWARRCQGGHRHVALRGRVQDEFRCWVFATKLAQVYARSLCVAIAFTVKEIVSDPGSQFLISFKLVASDKERKRPLEQNMKWTLRRQQAAAHLAQAAGYQLKRGAAKPLLQIECESGQAIGWAINARHPFTVPAAIAPRQRRNVQLVTQQPEQVCEARAQVLQFWEARARSLVSRKDPDQQLRALDDPWPR